MLAVVNLQALGVEGDVEEGLDSCIADAIREDTADAPVLPGLCEENGRTDRNLILQFGKVRKNLATHSIKTHCEKMLRSTKG
jgi:hypothetical protein